MEAKPNTKYVCKESLIMLSGLTGFEKGKIYTTNGAGRFRSELDDSHGVDSEHMFIHFLEYLPEEKDKLRHEKAFCESVMVESDHCTLIDKEHGTACYMVLGELLYQYRQYLEKKGVIKDYQSDL